MGDMRWMTNSMGSCTIPAGASKQPRRSISQPQKEGSTQTPAHSIMTERFVPSRPDAHPPLPVQPSMGPTHAAFFPVAVSTPVSGNDWLPSENLHRVAVHRIRPSAPGRSHSGEGHLVSPAHGPA